ncbi:hypothetical protein [Spongiibacter sp. IMCC21906]|uniref:HvfA family oxazolone/thioamide-modified RiPP metallophore n=1 Tax=Spongiibacter sp. IMCC21906 TaxID=1620392 RepID=UPI001E465054|nr:hypothetical protein [Spongiibacter sp. IMCC21906]
MSSAGILRSDILFSYALPQSKEFFIMNKSISILGAAMVASSLASVSMADSAANPFTAKSLNSGYQVTNFGDGEAKCGESKCGEAKCGEEKKGAEAKCGESKCGEAKCGEEK